jgi:hypothetical protein
VFCNNDSCRALINQSKGSQPHSLLETEEKNEKKGYT